MRNFHKIVVVAFLVFFIGLSSSFALDSLEVKEFDNCRVEFYEIMRMFSQDNSHASTVLASRAQNDVYGYAICYDALSGGTQQLSQVISPPQSGNEIIEDLIRSCTGRNHVLTLYSQFNSHVDMSSVSNNIFTESRFNDSNWNANNQICYGLFENCRVQDEGASGNNEVVVGQVSHQTNAHIYSAEFSDDSFSRQNIVCEVPFCDNTNLGIMYPILFDFEEKYEQSDFTVNTTNAEFEYASEPGNAFTNSRSGRLKFTFIESPQTIWFTELYKQDWSLYNYLEFYIKPETSGSIQFSIENQTFIIDNYVVGQYKLLDWNLIRIPLSEVSNLSSITKVGFEIPSWSASRNIDSEFEFLVDTFLLLDTATDATTMTKRQYCVASSNGVESTVVGWNDNLDSSEFTCDQSSFMWTGQRCCGDGLYETYIDGKLGCYVDNIIEENTVFSYTNYSVNTEQFLDVFCPGDVCSLLVPLVSVDSATPSRYHITQTSNDVKIYFNDTNSLHSNKSDATIQIKPLKPQFIYGNEYEFDAQTNLSVAKDKYGYYFCGDLNQNMLDTFEGHSDNLTPVTSCTVVNDYFCSNQGFWSKNVSDVEGEYFPLATSSSDSRLPVRNASQRLFLSEDFDDPTSSQCCPHNSCWHAGKCFANQADVSFDEVIVDGEFVSAADGHRCINGVWEEQNRQRGLRQNEYGLCERDDQCFISNTIWDPIQPGTCIDSGEYYQDYYCHNGSWSTRTVLTAGFLKNFAEVDPSSQFTLHCDNFANVINFDASTVTQNETTYADLFEGSFFEMGTLSGTKTGLCDLAISPTDVENCVNNMCVLQKDDVFYIGTSFNQINDDNGEYYTPEEIFDELYVDLELDCQGTPNDDGFIECISQLDNMEWLYHEESRIILHSLDERTWLSTSLTSLQNWFNLFVDFFRSSQISRLIPDGSLIQILYEKQSGSNFHVAAYREEEGKARSPNHNYVVKYGESTTNVDTLPFICESLQRYNVFRKRDLDINEDVLTLRGCDTSNPTEIFVDTTRGDSLEVWSRITVSLRDSE